MESDRPEHDDEVCPMLARPCFSCHIHGTVNIGKPSDFKTRTWRRMSADKRPRNSYERGIPVSVRPDGSQVPYLRADGEIMRQKEFDQKARQIEENKRRAHNATASTS